MATEGLEQVAVTSPRRRARFLGCSSYAGSQVNLKVLDMGKGATFVLFLVTQLLTKCTIRASATLQQVTDLWVHEFVFVYTCS